MIYIDGGYKTPTPELEKNPCSFSKQNKGRVTTSIIQEMHIAMYDIYRWWVQNPNSRGGKKSYGFSVVMGGVVGPLNKSWD